MPCFCNVCIVCVCYVVLCYQSSTTDDSNSKLKNSKCCFNNNNKCCTQWWCCNCNSIYYMMKRRGGHSHSNNNNSHDEFTWDDSLQTILLTGIFHGISGQGHMLGVIPALTFNNISIGGAYLFAFCVGTMVAMSAFTAFVGYCGKILGNKRKGLPAQLSFFASIIAIFVGTVWIFQPLVKLFFFA